MIFCLTFLFFILPPLFANPDLSMIFSEWNFPLQSLCLFLLSLILIYINKNILITKKDTGHDFFYNFLFPLTLCFCSLFAISLFVKGLSLIFKSPDEIQIIKAPDRLSGWIFCILHFLFSAFYEESIYRFYLPDFLIDESGKKIKSENIKKIIYALIELFTCLLFSLAHSYAGFFAILNAFFAHIILRFFRKKTGNILTGFAAHFLYNILELLLITAS